MKSKKVLYIAARAPEPGKVKTRLAQAIGVDRATRLYQAFLRDLAARFAGAPFPVLWFITPDDAWHLIAPHVSGNGQWRAPLGQGDGDWTARQRRLFRRAAERGEQKVVLIASDSPQIGIECIEKAFRLFERHDVVLGPCDDGGYYLIGMNGWHDVLESVRMTTPTVLTDVLTAADRLGVSVAFTEPSFDVDVVSDLVRLEELTRRPDLPATAAVLNELGRLAV